MNDAARVRYTVVRYHYDPVRDEAINIGIIAQALQGLRFRLIDDWSALAKAYPFLSVPEVERKAAALASTLDRKTFRVFDYQENKEAELSASDPRVLSFLKQLANREIEFSDTKFAELKTLSESEIDSLVSYLFETLAQPPPVERPVRELAHMVRPRLPHATWHNAAKKKILKAAVKAGFRQEKEIDIEAAVSGKTRKWLFDLRIRTARMLIQHVLVLPNLEETYMDTAALGRIWQDVREQDPQLGLAAVYHSQNGVPRRELRAAEKLLAKDGIRSLFQDELEKFYVELRGQQRFRHI